MAAPVWIDPEEAGEQFMFQPFVKSLELLKNTGVSGENSLTNDEKCGSVINENEDGLCTDGDDECRAKDPSKCPVHGNKGGEKSMINDDVLEKLNQEIQSLRQQGLLNSSIGVLKTSVPINIESVDAHAVKQLEKRNITIQDAQSYIDNSSVMFQQGENNRLYVSRDGNAAVLMKGAKLITAYPSSYFDEGMKKFVEEVTKYE